MLDDLGLVPALAWLFKEVARPSGIEIHSNIDPVLDKLPDVHRTCIYRIVQEALTNASRHSAASNVDVSIRRENGQVIGFVVDDGRGFDRGAQKRGGLGLLGMEERVREIGGSVDVGSSPGTGTGRGRSRDRSDGLKAPA
jgi:signal transduction histidine kinase